MLRIRTTPNLVNSWVAALIGEEHIFAVGATEEEAVGKLVIILSRSIINAEGGRDISFVGPEILPQYKPE